MWDIHKGRSCVLAATCPGVVGWGFFFFSLLCWSPAQDFDWSKPPTPQHHVIKLFFVVIQHGRPLWFSPKPTLLRPCRWGMEVSVTILDKIMCFQPILYTAVSTSQCITVSAGHFKHTRMTSVNALCLLHISRLLTVSVLWCRFLFCFLKKCFIFK